MKGSALFMILVALVELASCAQTNVESNSQPVNHSIWDELVKSHVDSAGHVDYAGFVSDSTKLNAYLDVLRANHPNEKNWTKDERLAYWINAYNAFTVELVVQNYPCKSIKDLGGKIYKVNTPWDIRFILIEGRDYDLNNIEHDIIRKEFDEPRIHFAVNCASVSCPPLRNEAFVAEKLDAQLTDQARRFINDKSKNKIGAKSAQLSKIFSWFSGDFTKKMKLIDFINQYADTKMQSGAKLDYLEYDWNLNK